jgi:hypothetical protein
MQLIRAISLIPPVIILILSIIKLRKSALFIFLTQWGLHLSIISTLLTMECARAKNIGNLKLKRLTAVILEVTLAM